MFEEIIFKQKLKYISKNNKNKRFSSLTNRNKHFKLFSTNTKDSLLTKRSKPNNSLINQKYSRNNNNNLYNNLTSLIFKNDSNSKSIFNLTASAKKKNINLNINKLLQNKIKPYPKSIINKTFNKIINNNHIKKSDLIVKNYFDEREKMYSWKNPFKDYKEPLFIYEIIKFDKEKNKSNIKENTNYQKYFRNIKEIKHDKNKNNSLFNIHNQKVNVIIDKIGKDIINKNLKEIKKEEKRKLYMIELRDKVEIPSIKAQNFKKMVYRFLTKEIDIKEVINKENFYKKFENRINYIFDGLKIPTLKNKFIKNIIKDNNEWENINAINSKTLTYLNQLKFVAQKKRDKIKKFLETKTFVLDDNDNNDIQLKHEKDEFDLIDKEYLYNCQKYFCYKNITYKNVNINKNILIKNAIFQKYKIVSQNKLTEIL